MAIILQCSEKTEASLQNGLTRGSVKVLQNYKWVFYL